MASRFPRGVKWAIGLPLALVAVAGCEQRETESRFFIGTAGPADLASMEARERIGANSFREDVTWSRVEQIQGELVLPEGYLDMVEYGQRYSLAPVAILLYGNRLYDDGFPITGSARKAYVQFAEFVVSRLPEIDIWEIWNEWNLGIGTPSKLPGDPEDYVKLQSDTYKALKQEFPAKVYLGGAMAGIGRADGWTRKALDAGMLQFLDGLSFHPYVYWMSRRNRVPERGMLGLVAELEQLLAQYPKGSEVPLYVTEIGWPTHDAREGVTLRQQADYISRALLLLRANPRVRGVWVHTLQDRAKGGAEDMEAHFGLLFPDGSPKPAWFSFRDTAALLKNVVACQRIDFGEDTDALAGVELVDGGGRHHLAIWTVDEDSPWIVELACRVTPIRKVLSRSVIGSGVGPPIALSREPDGESLGSITLGPSPTVVRDVGKNWRIIKSSPRYE